MRPLSRRSSTIGRRRASLAATIFRYAPASLVPSFRTQKSNIGALGVEVEAAVLDLGEMHDDGCEDAMTFGTRGAEARDERVVREGGEVHGCLLHPRSRGLWLPRGATIAGRSTSNDLRRSKRLPRAGGRGGRVLVRSASFGERASENASGARTLGSFSVVSIADAELLLVDASTIPSDASAPSPRWHMPELAWR